MLTVEGKQFSDSEVAMLRGLIASLTKASDGPSEVASTLKISPVVAAAVMGQMPPPPAEIQIPVEVVAAPEATPVVRKGGRPKGSKNKPKDGAAAPATPVEAEAPKRKGGRPKGSKNKPKDGATAPPASHVVEAAPAPRAAPPRITKFDADTLEVLKKRVAAGDTYESLAARLDVPVSLIISSLLD
jgi:hypothetical protein